MPRPIPTLGNRFDRVAARKVVKATPVSAACQHQCPCVVRVTRLVATLGPVMVEMTGRRHEPQCVARSWNAAAIMRRSMDRIDVEQHHLTRLELDVLCHALVELFLRQAPILERLLVEDGITLLKYWFSISDEEQQKRFKSRLKDPMRRWKLSETDLLSITKWEDYSRAKDDMFKVTDIPEAPWWTIEGDDKKSARLNAINHFLSQIPYKKIEPKKVSLPERPASDNYERPARELYKYVPNHAADLTHK